jgi:hypothetical protein
VSYEPLTEQKEKQLIDKIAGTIVKRKMEAPAILFLETMKPISFLSSQLALFTVSPFLTIFGEYQQDGYDIISLFEKPGNVERLIVTLETISKEKQQAEKKETEKPRDKAVSNKRGWRSVLRWLFS